MENNKEELIKSLRQLIELARQKVIHNHLIKFKITEKAKLLLENEFDTNFSEYQFQIDIYALKHIFKEHGNHEKKRNEGKLK